MSTINHSTDEIEITEILNILKTGKKALILSASILFILLSLLFTAYKINKFQTRYVFKNIIFDANSDHKKNVSQSDQIINAYYEYDRNELTVVLEHKKQAQDILDKEKNSILNKQIYSYISRRFEHINRGLNNSIKEQVLEKEKMEYFYKNINAWDAVNNSGISGPYIQSQTVVNSRTYVINDREYLEYFAFLGKTQALRFVKNYIDILQNSLDQAAEDIAVRNDFLRYYQNELLDPGEVPQLQELKKKNIQIPDIAQSILKSYEAAAQYSTQKTLPLLTFKKIIQNEIIFLIISLFIGLIYVFVAEFFKRLSKKMAE